MTIALIATSGPASESILVAAGSATLAVIPNYATVNVVGFTEIYTGAPSGGQVLVTPGSAVLQFNTTDNGATPVVKYFPADSEGVTVPKVNEIIGVVNTPAGGFSVATESVTMQVDGGGNFNVIFTPANPMKAVLGFYFWDNTNNLFPDPVNGNAEVGRILTEADQTNRIATGFANTVGYKTPNKLRFNTIGNTLLFQNNIQYKAVITYAY